MVSNINVDSSAVAVLTAYSQTQTDINTVQDAESTGYDVSKASDNPLFYLASTELRTKASLYDSYIPKLTQDKSAVDKLQATISNINDIATKLESVVTSMSSSPTDAEKSAAATQVKSYLMTIDNLINGSDSGDGFRLGAGKALTINAAIGTSTASASMATLTFTPPGLSIFGASGLLTKLASSANAQDITIADGTLKYAADLSTATNRANFLNDISNWMSSTLNGAATSVGSFSNTLDSQLTAMQTNMNGLNAEADALTKTDLTADSAKSTALSTKEQLLTSLLSMSNQRMSTVLSLFR